MSRDAFKERYLPGLLEKLYDAALDPALWPQFLDALRAPFGEARGLLHIYDPAINAAPLFLSFGTEAEFLHSYQDYYATLNPYPVASFAALRPGKVNFSSRIVDEEHVAKSEFYNDWMRPQRACLNHLGVVLHKDERGMAVLAISPNDNSYAEDTDKYSRRLALLVPHLMRAVKLNQETFAARLSRDLYHVATHAVGLPIFLLTHTGKLIEANAAAEHLLRKGDALTLDPSGIIRATYGNDDTALRHTVANAAAQRIPNTEPLKLHTRSSDAFYLAWFIPFKTTEVSPLPLSASTEPRHVLLILTGAAASQGYPPEILMSVFNLTYAEARLASALAEGIELSAYARRSGVSKSTVRNQLKQVFHKTGAKRQHDLVALIGRTLRLMPNPN